MKERNNLIAMQRYQYGLDVLEFGDPDKLAALVNELEGFPHGEDSYLGRRWITNAIDVGSRATVEWMLAQGVDLNFRDAEGYTPLHSAIERGLIEILDLLLVAGAPVNLKGINDWTPAHMAAARDDVDALRLLVRHGADLSIRTNIDDNATPLEEARTLGKLAAAKYLESVV